MEIEALKEKFDLNHKQQTNDYRRHTEMLEYDKAAFIANNPDFPKEKLKYMFLNVIAPPQNISIRIIK